MTPRDPDQLASMPGMNKAAVLLATLGEQASAALVKHLTEEEIQQVSQAIAQMDDISSVQAEGVVEEFYQMLLAQRYVVKGGLE
ncbi:MAG: magnesium and cobalt transport protein CorA, partial [Bryobacteraceae bacterium]